MPIPKRWNRSLDCCERMLLQKVSATIQTLKLLCEPELSIVAFTRTGWTASDYQKWSDELLTEQVGFIPPSSHDGQPISAICHSQSLDKIQRHSDLILQRL